MRSGQGLAVLRHLVGAVQCRAQGGLFSALGARPFGAAQPDFQLAEIANEQLDWIQTDCSFQKIKISRRTMRREIDYFHPASRCQA
jgi:hypothetical protein